MQCKNPYPINVNEGPSSEVVPGYGIINNQERFYVPCNKCTACRIRMMNEKTTRILMEQASPAYLLDQQQQSCFVTLTYADEYCPMVGIFRDEDVVRFIKRLRRNLERQYPGRKIRIVRAREFGDKSLRSHYHLIIFGLGIDHQLSVTRAAAEQRAIDMFKKAGYKNPERKAKELTSLELELYHAWEYGLIHVGEVNSASSRYMNKSYVMKSINSDKSDRIIEAMPRGANYEPMKEKVSWSNRPGIGASGGELIFAAMAKHGIYPAHLPELKLIDEWRPVRAGNVLNFPRPQPFAKGNAHKRSVYRGWVDNYTVNKMRQSVGIEDPRSIYQKYQDYLLMEQQDEKDRIMLREMLGPSGLEDFDVWQKQVNDQKIERHVKWANSVGKL